MRGMVVGESGRSSGVLLYTVYEFIFPFLKVFPSSDYLSYSIVIISHPMTSPVALYLSQRIFLNETLNEGMVQINTNSFLFVALSKTLNNVL